MLFIYNIILSIIIFLLQLFLSFFKVSIKWIVWVGGTLFWSLRYKMNLCNQIIPEGSHLCCEQDPCMFKSNPRSRRNDFSISYFYTFFNLFYSMFWSFSELFTKQISWLSKECTFAKETVAFPSKFVVSFLIIFVRLHCVAVSSCFL